MKSNRTWTVRLARYQSLGNGQRTEGHEPASARREDGAVGVSPERATATTRGTERARCTPTATPTAGRMGPDRGRQPEPRGNRNRASGRTGAEWENAAWEWRRAGAVEQGDEADEALGGAVVRTARNARRAGAASCPRGEHGRGHRFAAYRQCWADQGWSERTRSGVQAGGVRDANSPHPKQRSPLGGSGLAGRSSSGNRYALALVWSGVAWARSMPRSTRGSSGVAPRQPGGGRIAGGCSRPVGRGQGARRYSGTSRRVLAVSVRERCVCHASVWRGCRSAQLVRLKGRHTRHMRRQSDASGGSSQSRSPSGGNGRRTKLRVLHVGVRLATRPTDLRWMEGPPNKAMKLTRLSAALGHGWPEGASGRCRLVPARARMDAG